MCNNQRGHAGQGIGRSGNNQHDGQWLFWRIFVDDEDGLDDDHDYLLVVDEEDGEYNSKVDSARHHPLILLLFLPHPVINKLFLILL